MFSIIYSNCLRQPSVSLRKPMFQQISSVTTLALAMFSGYSTFDLVLSWKGKVSVHSWHPITKLWIKGQLQMYHFCTKISMFMHIFKQIKSLYMGYRLLSHCQQTRAVYMTLELASMSFCVCMGFSFFFWVRHVQRHGEARKQASKQSKAAWRHVNTVVTSFYTSLIH